MRRRLLCLLALLFTSAIAKENTTTIKAENDYVSYFDGVNYKLYSNIIMFWSNQDTVKDLYLPGSDSEKYNDDATTRWNGMSYIAKTDGGRIWTSFGTGGYLEPDNLNYSVLKYSDDDGKTWSKESIIIDNIVPENHIYPPILFYDEGKLIFYLSGYVFYFDNPDCENPSENINFPKKFYYSGTAMCHAPLKLSDDYYVTTCENSSNPSNIRIIASTNALIWEDIATVYSARGEAKKWNEGQICKLSTNQLMLLARIDGGSGLEVAISEDEEGYSWGSAKTDLESPLVGPYSKACIVNTNDGGIVLINHDSTSSREKLCCFLSYDDGKTWPYKFVLDDREGIPASYWGISYPDAIVDKDNNIYITWDQRTPTAEILNAKLSVEDIKAGEIVSEGSYSYNSVRRCSNYYDIKSIEEEIDRYIKVEVGTTKSSIISDLPTVIHYTDTKGNSFTSNGEWKTENYNGNEEGLYSFYFELDNKDEYLLDSYSLLKIRVKVFSKKEEKDNNPEEKDDDQDDKGNKTIVIGCNSNVGSISLLVFIALLITLITIKKHKKYE